jgi:hypothetical protein
VEEMADSLDSASVKAPLGGIGLVPTPNRQWQARPKKIRLSAERYIPSSTKLYEMNGTLHSKQGKESRSIVDISGTVVGFVIVCQTKPRIKQKLRQVAKAVKNN